MELILKNVKKKDFPVLKSLAKSLGFEIVQEVEKPYNPEFVKINLLDKNLRFDFMLDDGPHTIESLYKFIELYKKNFLYILF